MNANTNDRVTMSLLRKLCALLAVIAAPAFAAPAVPMSFSHLTLDDGLTQSNVQTIYQDSSGYLWFGTESGLNRYDGYTIKRYLRERGNPSGFTNDFIWIIAEDANRDLWIATRGGGVVRWNRATDSFDSFRHDPANPNSLSSDDVRTLLVNSDGTLWVGTSHDGLNLVNPADGTVQRYRHDPGEPMSLSGDDIYAVFRDRTGQLWVGADNGLNRMIGNSGRFVRFQHNAGDPNGLADSQIRTINEDSEGTLWIGTREGGLHQLQRSSGNFIRYQHDAADVNSLSDNHIRVILEDDANRFWVGTANGLNLLDRESGRVSRYYHEPSRPESLNDSYINSLIQDRGGNLWVGTRSAGASKWNPQSWRFGHYVQPWLRDSDVTSFATDQAGYLWVGTLGGGLARIDQSTGAATRYRHVAGDAASISDDDVMSLLVDREGVLWLGTLSSGLDRIDLQTGEIRNYRHDEADATSLPADGVMTIFEDRAGNLWVGTYGGGLGLFDRASERFTRYAHDANDPSSLGSPRASAIVEDVGGTLWVGTFGGGLNRFDAESGTFERIQNIPGDPESLSDDAIYDLHVDESGDIWVGTSGGGLDRLVRPSATQPAYRFVNVSQEHGLSSNVVYSVKSDLQNRLWLSTNYGITRYDPRDGSTVQYHRGHGMQGEEFNYGAHFQADDGRLYFGGANGFNAFAPKDLDVAGSDAMIVLTDYRKLNQPVESETPYDLLEQLDLSYRDSVVTLAFAALDFTAPSRIRYAYKLDGFDRDWVQLGTERRVTYTNLDAGTYRFRVRAATAGGVWGDRELSIPVIVSPAPWATWWAYTLYGVFIMLSLWIVWRSLRTKMQREAAYSQRLEAEVAERTEELEESNHELRIASRAKSDFLARMSHEIRTPMNGMLGMTQLLMGTQLDNKQTRFAEMIKRSAETLLDIINDILDFSKIEAGKLELDEVDFDVTELVEETVDLFSASASRKGLELMSWTPSFSPVSVVGDPLRLKQILVNLLGNAIKFTRDGEVLLRYTIPEEDADSLVLRFEVTDTGIGIKESSQNAIFELFSQEDGSTTRRFGGTGLGLAICKQLVETMGGTIGVKSRPGEGSVFWFTVPIKKNNTSVTQRTSNRLSHVRVLVADDSKTNARILGSYLAALGIDAETAHSGEETLKRLIRAATDDPFDVVLIDESLGDMSGLDFARAVRSSNGLSGTRLVLLSPIEGGCDVQEWRDAGVDDYLPKPIRQSILYECLLLLTATTGTLSAQRLPKAIEETGLSPLSGKVLLVEDNPVNQAVAEGMLAELGCDVSVADNGQEAVDMTATRHFDVVLMDCEMPVMDGFSATAKIQQRESDQARLPIIALTANAIEGDRQRCLEAGMQDYISKPVTMEALHEALAKWLPTRIRAEARPLSPSIDRTALDSIRSLRGVGGDRMVQRVISMYLTNSSDLVTELKTVLQKGDAEAVRQRAHALKSSSQNVGATAMAALSLALEEMGREGRLQQRERYLEELDQVYPLTVQALKHELHPPGTGDG